MIVSAINNTGETIDDHVEQTILRPGETVFEGEIMDVDRLERLVKKYPEVRFSRMPEKRDVSEYSNRFLRDQGHLEDGAAWVLMRMIGANPEGARRLCNKIGRLLSGEQEAQIESSDLAPGPNTEWKCLMADLSETEQSALSELLQSRSVRLAHEKSSGGS